MRFRTVVLAFLISAGGLLCWTASARAEPIQVTSGILSLDSGPSGFRLVTSEFTARADWTLGGGRDMTAQVFGPYRDCFISTCLPGMTFDPGMSVSSTTLGRGFGSYQGTSYDSLFFSGSMTAAAAPGVVPDISGFRLQTFHPFDFTGSLLAFTNPARTGDPLFAFDLVGQGHVGVWWQPAVPHAWSYELFYRVGAADPIPEPGTLLLVGTGVALGWRRLRRVRRRDPEGAGPTAAV